MKIGVLLKQVPDTEAPIRIKPDGSSIDDRDVKWVVNPYDEIAVEEALRLREKVGGEVVVVTVGLARVLESLRQALAMGADRGIRVDADDRHLDAHLTAVLLSKVCGPEGFDVIFAGKQAVDDGQAGVHIGVAECLGLPHVSPVEKFELMDGGFSVRLVHPAGGSQKEIVESSLPVVIGCEKSLNEPRYPTLPGIMKARSKPVVELSANALFEERCILQKVLSYEYPPERVPGRIIEGSALEASDELVKRLREEAKII